MLCFYKTAQTIKAIVLAGVLLCHSGCAAQKRKSSGLYSAQAAFLYRNLSALQDKGVMLGHQDDLAYGVNWKYEAGRSDVKESAGDYPAVYGWDLGGIEHGSDKDIDGVPFNLMRQYIIDAHARGGVITFSWHMDNPLTGKDAWDTTPGSLASVLPGGSKHELYRSWLDKAAAYMKTLKDKNGLAIPLLFRPFHELTGTWFWWCQNNGSAQEFVALWKFTHEYLHQLGVNQLLYVYNTSDFKDQEDFMRYYPGDAYVDIISFDKYQMKSAAQGDTFLTETRRQLQEMSAIGRKINKPIAIAETGYEAIPDPEWWTKTLGKAMEGIPVSYVLLWRNHGWNAHMDPPRMHYYAPFKGQVSETDFLKFCQDGRMLLNEGVRKLNLYTP